MKKSVLFLFTILLFATLTAQNVVRTELLNLAPGEYPVFSESNLAMNCGTTGLCILVEASDSKYYVYHSGIKSGPFNTAEEAMKVCKYNDNSTANRLSESNFNGAFEPVYGGDGAKIIFKGISYGPYKYITATNASPDKQHFMAVAQKGENMVFVSDLMPETIIQGQPQHFHWNANNTTGMTVLKTGFDMNSLNNIDFSSMSEAEQVAYMQKLGEAIENTKEELYILFTDGKKYGPFDSGSIGSSNPAFLLSAPGHWTMSLGAKLLIDGTVVKDFGDNYFNLDEVYFSPDGTQYAVLLYDKIVFSDGKEYTYPILVNQCNNNSSQIEWICFENESKIVYYSRTW
ncbi:MAG: hypothetical protein CVU11_07405 [Bacteroidetes bacterium HGW-Bacteroidetes-6]|nr:MAG: hypothetical protein CVU11_07405 [Bacteroidetes bacterium HGW-Bacteroidetes-6]